MLLCGGLSLLAVLLEHSEVPAQDGLRQAHLVLELIEGVVEALAGDGHGALQALLHATGAAAGLVLFDEAAGGQ
jgi:hypothetical protein